jgi:hypothetical protein
MTKDQFSEWLKVHCGLFDGVRRFAKPETLDEWERLLSSTPLEAAIAASRRIYESENRPRDYSDHAIAVKRAAAEINRTNATYTAVQPVCAGEIQGRLRDRFEEAWKAIDDRERQMWIAKAKSEINNPDLAPEHFGWKLVLQYAETLHAEQCSRVIGPSNGMTYDSF